MMDSFFTSQNAFDQQVAGMSEGTVESLLEAGTRHIVKTSGKLKAADRLYRLADIVALDAKLRKPDRYHDAIAIVDAKRAQADATSEVILYRKKRNIWAGTTFGFAAFELLESALQIAGVWP